MSRRIEAKLIDRHIWLNEHDQSRFGARTLSGVGEQARDEAALPSFEKSHPFVDGQKANALSVAPEILTFAELVSESQARLDTLRRSERDTKEFESITGGYSNLVRELIHSRFSQTHSPAEISAAIDLATGKVQPPAKRGK